MPTSRPARHTTDRNVSHRTAFIVGLALVVAAAIGLAPGTAHAQSRIVDVRGAIVAGGMTGWGSGGSTDFFKQSQGPGLGLELGLRVLVIDMSLRFVQLIGGDGREGTLSTLLIGPSFELPLQGGGTDIHGHARASRTVLRLAAVGGVGFGTPAPVNPPLSADQISGKGFLGLARVGIEHFFNSYFGLEAHGEAGYHYFIGGEGLINGQTKDRPSGGGQLGLFVAAVGHIGI